MLRVFPPGGFDKKAQLACLPRFLKCPDGGVMQHGLILSPSHRERHGPVCFLDEFLQHYVTQFEYRIIENLLADVAHHLARACCFVERSRRTRSPSRHRVRRSLVTGLLTIDAVR